MYLAKGQGKGRYAVFEPTMHQSVVRGFELRADLEQAIDARQFVLHYQPIIELATRRLAGFEALVRWDAPRARRCSRRTSSSRSPRPPG